MEIGMQLLNLVVLGRMQLDAVLGQASAVGTNLGEQRNLFENTGSKLMNLTAKFPMVNSIMNSIRRKKSKVRGLRLQPWPALAEQH